MTPDAIARSYDTSIMGRRWLGCWVDFIALGALFLIPDALLGNATYQRLLPLWIVLAALYFPVTEGLTGRSLGKLATRTIVVNARGEKPGSARRSCGRSSGSSKSTPCSSAAYLPDSSPSPRKRVSASATSLQKRT